MYEDDAIDTFVEDNSKIIIFEEFRRKKLSIRQKTKKITKTEAEKKVAMKKF